MDRIGKIIRAFTIQLKCPVDYLNNITANTEKLLALVASIGLFIAIGSVLNIFWPFPRFAELSCCLVFVGVLTLFALNYFSKKIKAITAAVASQRPAKNANYAYFRYGNNSLIYIFGPLAFVTVFGLGAFSMFGAFSITPTLFWMVMLFFIVVYISIIGYIQYIVLALYIYKLAHGVGEYRGLSKSLSECVPAHTEWLQSLTKLSHTYRSVFFTLGSAYILLYSAFCWYPEMKADTLEPAFLILWALIFIAIVLVFPIVSALEYIWIKAIVEQLKLSYVKDLAQEGGIQEKTKSKTSQQSIHRLMQTLCANQILNSKSYPLKSAWATGYAGLLSAFNFVAAMVTILQGFPALSTVLPHIL